MKIRCSSLTRALKCPGYLQTPAILLPDSEYAKSGSEIHAEAERRCLEQISDPTFEFARYVDFYINAKKKNAEIYLEKKGENEYLKGTADMIAYMKDSKVLYVNDLKTGFQKVSPDCDQLKGYALLNLRPQTEKILCSVFQHGTFETATFTRQDILDFEKEIKESIGKTDLALGEHCQFCEQACPLQQKAMTAALGFPASITALTESNYAITQWLKKSKEALMNLKEAPKGFEFQDKETSRSKIITEGAPDILKRTIGITLTEAKSMIKAGVITKKMLSDHTVTTKSKTKVLKRVKNEDITF